MKPRMHPLNSSLRVALLAGLALAGFGGIASAQTARTTYHSARIEGIELFYREAGPRNAPVVVLLHGFPPSSHMFRNLIPELATRHRVIAPDYPGFGESDAPARARFEYSFAHFAALTDSLLAQLGAHASPAGLRAQRL